MDNSDEFFTIGSHSKKEIDVEAYECSCCVERIRTKSDDEKDNNLDSLPRCSEWSRRLSPLERRGAGVAPRSWTNPSGSVTER